MSGASIPYHLRAHKAVDRRIFVDLLTRFERWKPLSKYVYVSMGAYPLEDHRLVHRILGITRLIAFDCDEAIVARQIFNRPLDTCHCLHKKSGDLIADLDNVLANCSFSDAEGVVVWLDYTDPKKIGTQIREFQSLLDKLRPGDLVRITVNANPNELLDAAVPGDPPPLATEKMEKQFKNIKKWVGEFLPSSASPDDMTEAKLPILISQSFAAAALKAFPVGSSTSFFPLSVVRYKDTTQMLSITGVLIEKGDEADLISRLDMASWPLASNTWSDVRRLIVPALTLRERLLLERGIVNKSAEELISELGFSNAADVGLSEFIESYKDYYRFYPTMLPAEV